PELSTYSHKPPFTQTGVFYWRVRARDVAGNWGAWSAVRSYTILPLIPAAPALASPVNGSTTTDSTPEFAWVAIAYGNTYQIQIDTISTFASPDIDWISGVGVLIYTPGDLPDGRYYWRVRAINSLGEVGAWSVGFTFMVDTIP
ncbi:MAG: hypothetical protein HYZ26_09660, partial [Chloroflexi bacterium]|nr:hypothetical protein [Chloroflexota bacterium]